MPRSGLAVSTRDRTQPDERMRALRGDPEWMGSWLEKEPDSTTRFAPEVDRDVDVDELSPPRHFGEYRPAGDGMPARRTVTIRGQGAERYVPRSSSRRRPERRYERTGFRPDRAAMWAVLLGVMLILAAVASAHAATLHTVAGLH
jgi:hypothetical protein